LRIIKRQCTGVIIGDSQLQEPDEVEKNLEQCRQDLDKIKKDYDSLIKDSQVFQLTSEDSSRELNQILEQQGLVEDLNAERPSQQANFDIINKKLDNCAVENQRSTEAIDIKQMEIESIEKERENLTQQLKDHSNFNSDFQNAKPHSILNDRVLNELQHYHIQSLNTNDYVILFTVFLVGIILGSVLSVCLQRTKKDPSALNVSFQIQDLNEIIQQLDTQTEELNITINELKTRNRDFIRECENYKTIIKELSTANNVILNEKAKVEENKKLLDEQLCQKEEELMRILADNTEQLQNIINDKDKTIESITKKYSELEKRLSDEEKVIINLTTDVQNQKNQIEVYKQKLEDKGNELRHIIEEKKQAYQSNFRNKINQATRN